MKRIVYVTALLAFAVANSNAQQLSANNIPTGVKSAFAKAHANVSKVIWSKEDKNFEAEFTLNGKEVSEVYTATGVFVESEVAIKTAELPATVKLKLKNQKISEAAKITKANGSVIYEAEVKGKDLLFDVNGNPVKL